MDTLTTSRSPTTVITADGEVQTHEEATVYVKELDIFLTMKVLEDTPAVFSLGKLCDEHGYSYEWINGKKPHLIKNGIRIECNTENFVPIVFLVCQRVLPPACHLQHPWHLQGRKLIILRETRARWDMCGIDSYPVTVSSKHVEGQQRGDLFSSGTPEEELLTKPTENWKPNKNEDHDLELWDLLNSNIPE